MPHAGTMQALRAHHRGGPEQLVWEPAPAPAPAAGEVVLAVAATGITFAELSWDLTWQTGAGADRTPTIPGHEVAGRVVEVGAGVTDLQVGDQVYGLLPFDRDGAAAELVAVAADHLAPAPRTVDAAAAAALPLAGLTAWQALALARVEPGEHVLVQGGAGGVGVYAVQLAVGLGARVSATAASEDVELVRDLGATEVLERDAEPFDQRLSGVDVVVDTVGGEVLDRSYAVLRLGGRLVTLAAPPAPERARQYGVEASFFVVEPNREQLAHLASLVDDGSLRPVVARTFPASEGRAAYESGSLPRRPGKTVLCVDARQVGR